MTAATGSLSVKADSDLVYSLLRSGCPINSHIGGEGLLFNVMNLRIKRVGTDVA